MRPRRISFTEIEAEAIYEWLDRYWRDSGGFEKSGCWECQGLGKRLEKFIGPNAVKQIKEYTYD